MNFITLVIKLIPSSLSNGVSRIRIIPEEDNIVPADTDIQLHCIHTSCYTCCGGLRCVLTCYLT